jgi:hypothetical protein
VNPMQYLVYGLAIVSIVLAVGGLSAYAQSKHRGLLLSSLISIACALAAIVMISWWPLVIGFAANWGLRLLGLDPGARK